MDNHTHHYDQSLINRLKRVKGQVDGVLKLLENNADCIKVMQQCKAIRGATQKIEEKVLEEHLRACLVEAIKSGDDSSALVKEIVDLYGM